MLGLDIQIGLQAAEVDGEHRSMQASRWAGSNSSAVNS